MIWDSRAVLNSRATETQMRRPVALNTDEVLGSISLNTIAGTSATSAKKIAPNKVILLCILFR